LHTLLVWESSDPDGDELSFDVFLGRQVETQVPVILGTGGTSVGVSGLEEGVAYDWAVVARDPSGESTRSNFSFSTERDTQPPVLSGVSVGVNQESATLTWDTDEKATSQVSFGIGGLGSSAGGNDMVQMHSVELGGLEAATWYRYAVQSADAGGNISPAFIDSFLTLARPDTDPPELLAGPLVEGLGLRNALVLVRGDELTVAQVLFALSGEVPSSGAQVQSEGLTDEHRLRIEGLEAGTAYDAQVILSDAAGNVTTSSVFSFTTLEVEDAIAPVVVSGPAIRGVTDAEALVEVGADEPVTAMLSYGQNADLSDRRVVESTTLQPAHQLRMVGLLPGTTYFAAVELKDGVGNTVTSGTVEFTTLLVPDTEAPVFVNGPIVDGLTDVGVVLSFDLNEPAQVRVLLNLPGEDAPFVRENVDFRQSRRFELTRLAPDTDYTFEVQARDRFGNSANTAGAFRTALAPDIEPPAIVEGPFAEGVKEDGATLVGRTNELSTAVFFLGKTAAADERRVDLTGLEQEHRARFTGLESGVEYHVRLVVTDAAGNSSAPLNETFSTLQEQDLEPPVVVTRLNFQGITQTSAIANFAVDEPVEVALRFGTDAGLAGAQTLFGSERRRNHSLVITGLSAATTYFVGAEVRDVEGNVSRLDGSFTTAAEADTQPPSFDLGPVITDLQATGGRVVFNLGEPGDAEVLLGTSADLAGSTVLRVLERKRNHAIGLLNLSVDTDYFLQAKVSDAAGNTAESGLISFRTPAAVVSLPPLITNGPVAQNVRSIGAEIFWRTQVASDGRVEYFAVDTPDDVRSLSLGALVTDHKVLLTNLRPGVLYNYNVRSRNSQRLESAILSGSFTTPALPDTEPPIFVGPVFVADLNEDQARVGWRTDEPADSKVRFTGPDGVEHLVSDPETLLEHSVVLNGLVAGTRYTFFAFSTDREGNGPTASDSFEFTTLALPDETAPLFTKRPIVKGRTETTMSLAFSTNEPTTSTVSYGLTAAFETGTVSRPELVTDHEVLLTQLQAGLTYLVRIAVVDAAGNGPTVFPGTGAIAAKSTQEGDATFAVTTLSEEDLRAPSIIGGPLAVSTTGSGAVIEWNTDELADGSITAIGGGDTVTVVDSEFRREHRLVLSGLHLATAYRFRVASGDVARNGPTRSDEFEFVTEGQVDTQAPNIIAGPVALDVTLTQATLTWNTDEPASTVLDFGETDQYGEHIEQGDLVQQHKVTLTGLKPGSTYHFKVSSRDLANNLVSTDPAGLQLFSQDHTFSTLGGNDDQAPVFLATPVVQWTDETAVITWLTDELSTSRVDWAGGDVQDFIEGNTLQRQHSLTLTGLQKRTSYFFRVASVDAAGNEAVWGVAELASLKILAAAETDPSLQAVAKALQPPGGAGRFITRNVPDTRFPVITAGPTVREKTATSVTLEWQTNELADSFVRFGEADTDQVKGSAQDVLLHRVQLTNLEPGEKYSYVVESTDPSGNGAARSRVGVTTTASEVDLSPPRFTRAPRVLARTDRSGVIEWRTDEAATARIEYWPASNASQVLTRRLNQRERSFQATLTNLRASTDYVVRVYAIDGSQNEAQAPVDVALRTEGQADGLAPRIVSGPTVLEVGNTSATIEWKTDELADSFVKYDVKAYLGQVVGSPELSLTHRIVLTDLEPGRSYFYKVGSRDAVGNGPTESRMTKLTTSAGADTQAPLAPADLNASGGLAAVLLEWTANQEIDLVGYTVYRQNGPGFVEVATNVEEPFFRDTGRRNGTEQRYRVTATDRAGNESTPSAVVSATPGSGGGAPSAPSIVGLQRGLTQQQPIVRIGNASGGSGGQRSYTVQISTRPDFGTIVDRAGNLPEGATGETRWRVRRRLNPQIAYWFRARAFDGRLNGPWSQAVQLRPSSAAALLATDDLDGDGAVSFADFFVLANGLGGANPLLDLDLNGQVDDGDVILLGQRLGEGGSFKASDTQGIETVEPASLVVTAKAIDDGTVEVVLSLDRVGPVTGYGFSLGYDPLALSEASLVDTAGRPLQVPNLGVRLWRDLGDRVLVGEHYAGRLEAGPLRQAELARLRFDLGSQRQYAELTIEEGYISRGGGDILRVGSLGSARVLPRLLGLYPNYPNPFNPSTTIPFALPQAQGGGLSVYNALGQLVRAWDLSGYRAGFHALVWDGEDQAGRQVGSGVYIVRLNLKDKIQTHKITLIK
jgi:hypothetical protein